MSGHADTVRRYIDTSITSPFVRPQEARDALDELVAENQRLTAWQADVHNAFDGCNEPDLDTLPTRIGELVAENQQLRDALVLASETIRGLADQQAMPDDFYQATLARISAALAGTPSEDTE